MRLTLGCTFGKPICLHLEAISSSFIFMSDRSDVFSFHLSYCVKCLLIHSDLGQQRGVLFMGSPWASTVQSPLQQAAKVLPLFSKWRSGSCSRQRLELGLVQLQVCPSVNFFSHLPIWSFCVFPFFPSPARDPWALPSPRNRNNACRPDAPVSGKCAQPELTELAGFTPCGEERSALLHIT